MQKGHTAERELGARQRVLITARPLCQAESLSGSPAEVMNSFAPPSPFPYLVEKNSVGSVVLTPRQEPSWRDANFPPNNSRNSVIWRPSGAKSSPAAPAATT